MKCKISTYDISTRSISNKNCVKQRCHEHIDPPPPPFCSIHPQNTWRSAQSEVEEESKFLFFGLFFKHRRELVTGGKVRRTRCFPLDSSNQAKHSSCSKLFGAIPPLVLRVHTRFVMEKGGVARKLPVPGNDLSLPLNDSNLSWTLTSAAYFHVEPHPSCARSS